MVYCINRLQCIVDICEDIGLKSNDFINDVIGAYKGRPRLLVLCQTSTVPSK